MYWWKTIREKKNNLVESLESEEKHSFRVFFLFNAVAIPVLLGFALFHLFSGRIFEFLLIIPIPLFLLLSRLLVLRIKNRDAIYLINIVLINIHFTRLLYIGGENGSNILWMLSFPLVAYVILGQKRGTVAVLVSFLVICLVLFMPPLSARGRFVYPLAIKVRFLIVYLVITLLSYLYESVRLAYRSEMEKRQSDLLEIQKDLLVAHGEIEKLSITDSLTRCFNRHYLTDRIHQELERAKRYSHPFALAVCDIDHFKSVNDNYGHAVGDRVLAGMGLLLRESVRDGIDWVVRYGGEEFIIVFPETPLEGAAIVADRIRGLLSGMMFPVDDRGIRITASFGVTAIHFTDDRSANFNDLFNLADKLLYQAKEEGRNRIVCGAYGSEQRATLPGD